MAKQRLYQPGERIGPYEVVGVLGYGSMGVVYEARDGERRAAVKVIQYEPGARFADLHAEDVRRMRREFSALLPLEHPNIVRALAFGETGDGLPWFAMEHIDGETLGDWMEQQPGPEEVASVLRKLAAGLAELHRLGLVHRDLKPSNVMLRQDGEPVLIDFGIVQSEAAPTLTQGRELIGNFRYCAPEVAARVLDERQHGKPFVYTPAYDVYALGMMSYQALAHRYPFETPADDPLGLVALNAIHRETPPHLSEVAPQVPRALGDLTMWMLHRDPERRPRDGAAVVAAFDAVRADGAARPVRRRRRALGLGAVVLAGVAAALLVPRARAPAPVRETPAPRVDARPAAPEPPAVPTLSLPPEKGSPALPLPPLPPKPAPALKPSTGKPSLERGAFALCAAVLTACSGAGVRPDGVPAFCPPPLRETSKRLGVPAGFDFDIRFLQEDALKLDYGSGPPRGVATGPNHLNPRYLLPIDGTVEMEVYAPSLGMPEPSFPMDSRIFGVVKPGKERTDIVFTKLKTPAGSEFPICAVAYTREAIHGGQRGMPVPRPPPVAPPGHVLVDTWIFTAHVLEAF